MQLHEVMGEYEDEGRFCEELGFCIALLETYLAKENPPTRPDRDFRKSPEICGDEDSAL